MPKRPPKTPTPKPKTPSTVLLEYLRDWYPPSGYA